MEGLVDEKRYLTEVKVAAEAVVVDRRRHLQASPAEADTTPAVAVETMIAAAVAAEDTTPAADFRPQTITLV